MNNLTGLPRSVRNDGSEGEAVDDVSCEGLQACGKRSCQTRLHAGGCRCLFWNIF